MKAIILSAGQGRRLLPLTEHVPKCCLMLEGRDWCEVDNLADYAHAEKAVSHWHDKSINPGARITNRKEYTRHKVA